MENLNSQETSQSLTQQSKQRLTAFTQIANLDIVLTSEFAGRITISDAMKNGSQISLIKKELGEKLLVVYVTKLISELSIFYNSNFRLQE